MVMIVPVGLFVVVGLLPVAAACLARDCFILMVIREMLAGGPKAPDELNSPAPCMPLPNWFPSWITKGRAAVLAECILTIWQYYVFLIIIQPAGSWLFIIYHLLLAMGFVCFWRTARSFHTQKPLVTTGPVICEKCTGDTPQVKPAGFHHCTTCNKCIDGMDHHCVFVNNCVARENRKSFILLLLYTLALAVLLLGCSWQRFIGLAARSVWDGTDCHVFLGSLVTIVIGLGALGLLLLQIATAANNMTTLDLIYWISYGVVRKPPPRSNNERLRNLMHVLGPCPVLWLWPTAPQERLHID
eukprot:TRINITY_DN11514_c0_g1_i1.p1 TRINITY_DN11514_c0_g1~~TRINITY_DN11514_c0_g1_i1.p1  ORF type:complete len:307 (-),score=26.21 TRINITY_DN11514_c0_g1_i1:3-902(-)